MSINSYPFLETGHWGHPSLVTHFSKEEIFSPHLSIFWTVTLTSSPKFHLRKVSSFALSHEIRAGYYCSPILNINIRVVTPVTRWLCVFTQDSDSADCFCQRLALAPAQCVSVTGDCSCLQRSLSSVCAACCCSLCRLSPRCSDTVPGPLRV